VLLADVNVLVYAFREDAEGHAAYRKWVEELIGADQAYGVSEQVLSGFLRVVTHPRVFDPPAPIHDAILFADGFREQPNAVLIQPGPRHWEIFRSLCRSAGARGNLVADAYLAALAIESGCEWITVDRDYAKFPGLHWRRPF